MSRRDLVGEQLTEAVLASFANSASPRFMVSAPGYQPVTTHVFEAGDEYLDSDAVFGVKQSLVAEFERHEPGTAPNGAQVDVPWYSVRYDFVLAPAQQ